jgi:MYXO-CTERM domain-containing protein
MTRAAALTILASALLSLPASAVPRRAQLIRTLPQPNATTPGTVCSDVPHLGYGGGALIQHVKVVDVFYSPGHKYKTMLEDFYKAITQSAHFDWLVEYNSVNYKIGRGSFVTSFEDTNVNPTTVKTVNPETWLKGLLTAKKLPAPDDDTMYMLYFPSGVDPSDGSGSSCILNGGYCAYHSSFATTGGQMVRYGVMPDMEAGSCNKGCGPPGFVSFTDVSSHELIEAVTDPDGSGWYDDGAPSNSASNCGEIGDICAVGGMGEVGMVNGFFVQNEWSNKKKACIATDASTVVNDFTVAVAPTMISVPVGGSAMATVTLTKTTGVAESVALTAPTPPTGLSAAFGTASVTSGGGTSALTIQAGPSLMPGATLTLTVKATGSVSNHSATVDVTIVAPPPPDMAMSGGTGGNGGSGGSGGGGGNGDHGGGSGCSVAGSSIAGSWALGALFLFALAFRRRRA